MLVCALIVIYYHYIRAKQVASVLFKAHTRKQRQWPISASHYRNIYKTIRRSNDPLLSSLYLQIRIQPQWMQVDYVAVKSRLSIYQECYSYEMLKYFIHKWIYLSSLYKQLIIKTIFLGRKRILPISRVQKVHPEDISSVFGLIICRMYYILQ